MSIPDPNLPGYAQPITAPLIGPQPEVTPPTAVPDVAGATGGPASTGGWEAPTPPAPSVNIPPNLAGGGQPPAMPTPPPQQQPAPISGQDMGLPAPFQDMPAQRGGPVKNALTRMLYGMGQAGLRHVGLPTDYDIYKQQYDQTLKANQLRINQAEEQRKQQETQYQQTPVTVMTPYGPVQMRPDIAAKVWSTQIGATSRENVAQTNLQKRTLNQRLGGAIQDVINNGGDPAKDPAVQAFSTAMTGTQKPNEMQQFVTNYLATKGLQPTPENWMEAHNAYVYAKAQPQFDLTKMKLGPQWANVSLRQQQFDRDTFGTLFGQAIPSSLVDEQGNTIGWKSPSAPTGTIKSQAQQAQDLGQLFRDVREEIKKADAAGLLGPGMGRLNEFMTGQVGGDNPQFAKLRTLNSMVLTGAMKAHFGARGGQQMFGHFENLYNTGKMTGSDMLASLDGFQTFMDQYAKRVQTAGGGGKLSPAAQSLWNDHVK